MRGSHPLSGAGVSTLAPFMFDTTQHGFQAMLVSNFILVMLNCRIALSVVISVLSFLLVGINAVYSSDESVLRSGLMQAKQKYAGLSFHSKFRYGADIYRIGMKGKTLMLSESMDSKTKTEVLRVKNESYAFEIYRQPNSKNYSLSQVVPISDLGITQKEMSTLRICLHPFYCHGWMIWDLFDQPSCRIVTVRVVEEHGRKMFQCEFEYKPTGKELRLRNREWACKATFDPDNAWAMTQQLIVEPSSKDFTLGLDMLSEPSGSTLPVGKKLIAYGIKNNIAEHATSSFEFVSHEAEPASDKMFYLSFYGMPEPNFSRPWFGPWIWFLGIGFICVFGAFVMTKLRSRRSPYLKNSRPN